MLVDQIATENIVRFGPQLIARAAWRAPGPDRILRNCGLNTAQLLVANRHIEPVSEWALIDRAGRTALPELLGVRITKTTKDRLHHAGDALFSHRKTIETALRDNQAKLFGSRGGIVLCDVTNTRFEGLCGKNPKARHGKNKQKRNDCRQIAIGMAFDQRGLPLAHEVFEGNFPDTRTLTRSRRAGFAEELAAAGFETVPGRGPASPVEVRTIPDPQDPDGLLVLCRSTLRREKELAMISKAEQRFLKSTTALGERIAKGRLKDAGKIQRAIGRLQAGEGFACLKGSLGLRPDFHQLEARAEARVFIPVLAYHLLTWVLHIRKATVPDAEQAQVYQCLGIDWKNEYPMRKSFVSI